MGDPTLAVRPARTGRGALIVGSAFLILGFAAFVNPIWHIDWDLFGPVVVMAIGAAYRPGRHDPLERRAMRVTIVYASIYGNTRQLATAMADALVADDHDVRLLPAGWPDLATLEGTELLLVGAPTQIHGWQLPVRDFLDSISRDGPSVPAAAFNTGSAGTPGPPEGTGHIAKSLGAARCSARR